MLLVVLMCLGITAPIEAVQTRNTFLTVFDSKLKRADRYFENFQYKDALELYLKVLEKEEDNQEVKLKTAECYRMLNQPAEAAPYYGEVLAAGYNDFPIYKYYYAQSLMSIGDYEGAQKWVMEYADETSDYQRVEELQASLREIERLYADSTAYLVNKLNINSDQSDFAPAFYQDGLVFVSSRETKTKKKFAWDQTPFLDLFYSRLQDDGSLGAPQRFSDKINSKYHEGPVAFYQDGQKILFTRSNYHDGTLSTSIDGINMISMYTAELDEDGNWTNIEPFEHNNKEYSTGHPTISADGYTLYFISDQPDGLGGTDIYKSTWNGVEWTEPQNLGPKINSKGNEMFPFVDNQGVLYFASNGKGGLGGLDIFRVDLTNAEEEASNLGYPINTKKDDFALILNPDGSSGYLSTNRDGSDDDLYFFQINPDAVETIANKDFQEMDVELPELQLTASNEPIDYVDNLDDYRFESGYQEPELDWEPNDWDQENTEEEVTSEEYVDNYEMESFDSYTSQDSDLTSIAEENESEFDEDNTIFLNSQVINQATYEPLHNAAVDIMVDGILVERLYTDDQGLINFRVSPAHDYQLVASKPGFQQNQVEVLGSTIDPVGEESIVIALESGASAIAIEATVVDKSNNQVLSGAQVEVYVDNSDRAVDYSLNQGIMAMAGEPETTYMIVASNPGYNDVFVNLSTDSLSTSETNTLTLPLSAFSGEDKQQIKNKDKLSLLGIVTNSKTGEMVAGARVKLFVNGVEKEQAISEQYGEVEFKSARDQSYMLLATHDDYQDLVYHLPSGSIDGAEHGFELAMIPLEADLVAEDHILEELQEFSTAPNENAGVETTEMIVIEDMLGEDQVFLSMSERIYQLRNEGYDTYLIGTNHRTLLGSNYDLQDLKDPSILNQVLAQHGYQVGNVIRVNNIYYDFDRSNIRQDAEEELNKLAAIMDRHQELSLTLGSHTDMRGSNSYNQALSERRAQSAVNFLADLGVDQGRLDANSFGESTPVNGCVNDVQCSEAQHQSNRRTEFKLVLDQSLSPELISSAEL